MQWRANWLGEAERAESRAKAAAAKGDHTTEGHLMKHAAACRRNADAITS